MLSGLVFAIRQALLFEQALAGKLDGGPRLPSLPLVALLQLNSPTALS